MDKTRNRWVSFVNSFFYLSPTRTNNILFCLLIALFISNQSFADNRAQNIQFSRITLDDGLTQETIYQVIQDRKGFIWLATSEGLNRYDGYNIKSFLHNDKTKGSISSDWIWAIKEDTQGQLWVGTDRGGLNKLNADGRTFSVFKHDSDNPQSISGDIVRVISEDDSGQMWIGTDTGLNLFDGSTFKRFQHDPNNNNSLSHNKVRDVINEQHGNLWVATDGGGVNLLDPSRGTFRRIIHDPSLPNSISSNRIRSLFESIDGMLWIGTYDKGVNRYNPRTGFVKRYHKDSGHGLNSNLIRDIIQDHRGVIWLATDEGLVEYKAESDSFVRYQNNPQDPLSLTDNRVTSLFQDQGNVLWVGTFAGLNKWNYQTVSMRLFRQNTSNGNGLRSNQILSFAETGDGVIWIGTYDGLHRYTESDERFKFWGKDEGLPDVRVTALIKLDNDLWIGTYAAGLIRLNLDSETLTHYPPDPSRQNWLPKGGITSLEVDRDNKLWIGNFGGGLLRYRPDTDDFELYQHNPEQASSIASNRVVYVTSAQNGELWLSLLGKGIARFTPEDGMIALMKNDPSNPDSLATNINWNILEDSKGDVWIGSQGGGLNLLTANERRQQNPKFVKISRFDGLPSNVVYSILEDSNKDLWLSSNRGLTRYSPANGSMRHFTPFHGLQAYEFNAGAALKSASGKMLFGGSNGFNAFFPTELRKNEHVPPVVITNIYKIDQPLKTDTAIYDLPHLQLSAKDYLASFEFAGLDYAAQENNLYKYMLEGYDKDWINSGLIRRASYTNLPSGDYTFRVQASNNDGVWNLDGASLKITVLPPWYLSQMAYLAYAALFLGFLALLYWLHLNRLKTQAKRNKQLKLLVDSKTEELQKRSEELAERNEDLKSLNKQLVDASYTDLETGLHSRHFVKDYMQKLTQTLERRIEKMSLSEVLSNHRPIFFVILDIDKFKYINDEFGHEVGDKVLLEIARHLSKQCRDADVVARWGDNAFLIAGETDDVDAILSLANRLADSINSKTLRIDDHKIKVKVSAGISYFPFSVSQPTLFTWEQVVTIARKALECSREKQDKNWGCIRPGQLGLTRNDFRKIISETEQMSAQQCITIIHDIPQVD